MERHGDAETLQKPRGIRFGLPAAELGKLLLQLRGADAVLVGEILLLIDGVLLLPALVKAGIAQDDGVQNGVIVVHILILTQDGHTALGVDIDMPLRGFYVPGKNLEECGFSCTVCANDAVAVAGGELQVRAGEKHLASVLQRKVFDCDHKLPSVICVRYIIIPYS